MASQEQETSMYDQPTLFEVDGGPRKDGAIQKPSKKHKKKARSLRDMAFETTQAAQTVMRHEMERGVHKPQRLGEVLDEVVGPQPDQGDASELSDYGLFEQDVPNLALEVIDQHGQGLRTGMREWAIIQGMVEAGIRRGYAERG
ncbi:hypothetical protein IXEL_61 [Microbacterium phage Ixel]|nr:hypothetical protein IXEL_61 [Microbacterium phage Ixel]